MLTVTLHWWYVPLLLLCAAFATWSVGMRQPGTLGGMQHFWIGVALLAAAVASLVTGVLIKW